MIAVAETMVEDNARDRRRKCLLAGRSYEAGEPVFALEHVTWCAAASTGAVVHPSGRHFRDPLLDGVVHSSDPNCRLSYTLMVLIARRDIKPGDVVTNDFERPFRGDYDARPRSAVLISSCLRREML